MHVRGTLLNLFSLKNNPINSRFNSSTWQNTSFFEKINQFLRKMSQHSSVQFSRVRRKHMTPGHGPSVWQLRSKTDHSFLLTVPHFTISQNMDSWQFIYQLLLHSLNKRKLRKRKSLPQSYIPELVFLVPCCGSGNVAKMVFVDA